MPTFESLVPAFIQKCAEFNAQLRLVALMLFIVGTILFAVHGVSGKKLMRYLVRLMVLPWNECLGRGR